MAISPDILKQLTSTASKWDSISRSTGLAIPTLAPLMQYDVNRIRSGSQPFSQPQSEVMALAAGGKQVVPAPSRGFFSRVMSDVGGIVGTVVHPSRLLNEISRLPEVPGDIGKAIATGSPRAALHELATQTPILRMAPGAFTVGALTDPAGLKAGLHQLGQHPVMAGIDLLALGEGPAKALTGRSVGELGVEGLKKLPGAPKVQEWWANLPVGTKVRNFMATYSPFDRAYKRAALDWTNEVSKTFRDKYKITTPEQMSNLVNVAEHGDARAWAGLADHERAALTYYKQKADELAHVGVKNHLAVEYKGEVYSRDELPRRTWDEINALHTARDKVLAANTRSRPRAYGHTTWDERAAYHEARIDRALATRPPARFSTLVAENLRGRIRNIVKANGGSIPDWEDVLHYVEGDRFMRVPGMSDRELRDLAKGSRATWQQMRASGLNPMWVHHVGEDALGSMRFPTLRPEREMRLSQTRKRTMDMAPYKADLAISLGHAGMEWLGREVHTPAMIQGLKDANIVRPAEAVNAEIDAESLAAVRARGLDRSSPGFGDALRREIEQRKNKDWETFDPAAAFPMYRAGVQERPGTFMIQKPVARAIRTMEKGPGELTRKIAPVMGVFRISVLGLNPKYYLHMGIGNMVAYLGQRDPINLAENLAPAVRMWREGKIPTELSRGWQEIPPETAAWQVQAGRTLGRWWSTLPHEKIWKLGESINDISRTVAYLDGRKEAIRAAGGAANLSESAAREAGVALANKVFQNWDTMTPFERQTIRSIMPFYGFSRYVLRYVSKYPFDHPLRASIIGNFARAELADQQAGGLPEKMRNLIFLGQPDAKGNVKAINTSGMNPFYDANSYLTFAGFAKRLNPAFGPLLSMFGVNDATNAPDLFPQLHYDPESGRLVFQRPKPYSLVNPLDPNSLLQQLIPQAGSITDLLGLVKDAKALHTSDPGAFMRQVFNGLGLGFVPTQYNVGLERGKEAKAKYDDFSAALSQLTAHGNATPLIEKYPSFVQALIKARGVGA